MGDRQKQRVPAVRPTMRLPGDAVGIQVPVGRIGASRNHWQTVFEARDKPSLYRLYNSFPADSEDPGNAMIVEVDPATMELRILKYVVVHDCGTVINPLIVAGQIQGGVAQGIGNAFYERLVFDEEGQLINGTLADYLLPTAVEVPRIEILHHVTPSPYNELGVKGVGEAGAIPVGALFAQAIEDALELPTGGIDILKIPLDPSHLWELAGRVGRPTSGDRPRGRPTTAESPGRTRARSSEVMRTQGPRRLRGPADSEARRLRGPGCWR